MAVYGNHSNLFIFIHISIHINVFYVFVICFQNLMMRVLPTLMLPKRGEKIGLNLKKLQQKLYGSRWGCDAICYDCFV